MPEGGTLRISVTAESAHSAAAESEWASQDPLCAVVRVSDTGVGIEPSITPRLFEPFFSTKGARGTGLGLAVVAEIVDRFGGAIHVESRLGAGTTFAVSACRPRPSQPRSVSWMEEGRPGSPSGRGCSSSTTRSSSAS